MTDAEVCRCEPRTPAGAVRRGIRIAGCQDGACRRVCVACERTIATPEKCQRCQRPTVEGSSVCSYHGARRFVRQVLPSGHRIGGMLRLGPYRLGMFRAFLPLPGERYGPVILGRVAEGRAGEWRNLGRTWSVALPHDWIVMLARVTPV